MNVQAFGGVITVAEQATMIDGPLGAIEALPSSATAGQLSMVVHDLAPRALGSPVHTHRNEDEYSLILDGIVGIQVGGTVRQGRPGDVVCKPRGVPHAFWNATDEPARLLDVITPGDFLRLDP